MTKRRGSRSNPRTTQPMTATPQPGAEAIEAFSFGEPVPVVPHKMVPP